LIHQFEVVCSDFRFRDVERRARFDHRALIGEYAPQEISALRARGAVRVFECEALEILLRGSAISARHGRLRELEQRIFGAR
jgi:hypothetical protein